jgi:hypothetical protein
VAPNVFRVSLYLLFAPTPISGTSVKLTGGGFGRFFVVLELWREQIAKMADRGTA